MYTMNAVVYQRDGETYVWSFREGLEESALESICQFASRSDMSLDWQDANLIWQRMGDEPDNATLEEVGDYLATTLNRK